MPCNVICVGGGLELLLLGGSGVGLVPEVSAVETAAVVSVVDVVVVAEGLTVETSWHNACKVCNKCKKLDS